ncbi:MAG: hypothetical protein PVSMB7_27030 [Chloroflexota bacterium]
MHKEQGAISPDPSRRVSCQQVGTAKTNRSNETEDNTHLEHVLAVMYDARDLQHTPEYSSGAAYNTHRRKTVSTTHGTDHSPDRVLAMIVPRASERERSLVKELATALPVMFRQQAKLARGNQVYSSNENAAPTS